MIDFHVSVDVISSHGVRKITAADIYAVMKHVVHQNEMQPLLKMRMCTCDEIFFLRELTGNYFVAAARFTNAHIDILLSLFLRNHIRMQKLLKI